jgi:hypothetical protein
MNARETEKFRLLKERLERSGVEFAGIEDMLTAYVRAEGRIDELHGREAKTRGKAKERATRALNVAIAERRRLHVTLFGKVKNEDADALTPDEVAEARLELEADQAWRAHKWLKDGSDPLTYGRPKMRVHLYASVEEEIEGYLSIQRNHRRARTGFELPGRIKLWLSEHPDFKVGDPGYLRSVTPPGGR